MGKTKVKESKKPLTLSKVVVYILLILLAITIIIPVGWVFVASVKQNSEFYGSPWVLPEKIYFQNFIDAWEKASMGTYMLNSVIVTALALLLLIVISLPAAYVLSRFKFKTSKFWNVLFMAGLFINVSYIVVPIFLMLNNWDKTLRQLTGGTFFLNNLFVLALVYASTALPFTIYLLSGYFRSLAKDFEEAAYVAAWNIPGQSANFSVLLIRPSAFDFDLFDAEAMIAYLGLDPSLYEISLADEETLSQEKELYQQF